MVSEYQITVGLCTYNRSVSLIGCLEGLGRQNLCDSEFEVILVNNGDPLGNDVLNYIQSSAINYTILENSRNSLSCARNLIVKNSSSPYVAFIDDDAIPSSLWLQQILESFDQRGSDVICVGGDVEGSSSIPFPLWLDRKLQCYLSIYQLANHPRELTDSEWLAGVNMAFRKDFLLGIGGFPEELGRMDNQLLSGEDIYVQQVAKKRGLNTFYNPKAKVVHKVEDERITKTWFIERMKKDGVSNFRLDRLIGVASDDASLMKTLIAHIVKMVLYFILSMAPSDQSFRYKCFGVQHFYYLKEFLSKGEMNQSTVNYWKSKATYYFKKIFYFTYSVVNLPVDILIYLICRKGHEQNKRKDGLNESVVHFSPDYFDPASIIGGGERYVEELCQAMAQKVQVQFVSFGKSKKSFSRGLVNYTIFPVKRKRPGPLWIPLSFAWIDYIKNAKVIHVHQYRDPISRWVICLGHYYGKRIFITDHGSYPNAIEIVPFRNFVTTALLVSQASANCLPPFSDKEFIGGGVPVYFEGVSDTLKSGKNVPYFLYVGRILPDKGLDYLVDAIPFGVPLKIVGRVYDQEFYGELCKRSQGKQVEFLTNIGDIDLLRLYRGAIATILPSVYRCRNGKWNPMPELMGLVLLESYSQGTPVIGTDVGGVSEFVVDGITGFLVPPNDSTAIREKINILISRPEIRERMGEAARREQQEKYSYNRVADKCLEAYSK